MIGVAVDAAAAAAGLVVGDALTSVVDRLPARRPLAARPACAACLHPLAGRDLLPVVSWMGLRGRCRHCRTRLAVRYPALEALTAGTYAATAARFGASWTGVAEVALLTGIVALAVIDFEHLLLPRRLVYTTGVAELAVLTLAAAVGPGHRWGHYATAVVCAAAELALLAAVNAVGGLGFGDVRLGPVIALGAGWLAWQRAVDALLVALVAASATAIVLLALRRATRRTPLPFGVFLAVGAAAAILVP